MTLILVLIGLVYFNNLSVRHYPAVDRPIISIKTQYEGASPEIIEGRVTKPIENALFGIEGIDFMTSDSRAEESVVKIFFDPNRNLDDAANDVRDRLSRIRREMPENAQQSTIQKSDSDSEPIIMVVFSSDTVPLEDITDYVEKDVKSEFEALPGVASVEIFGQQNKVVHIWLDPQKLASYQTSVIDVTQALKKQNINVPAGRITAGDREYYVNTIATLKSANEFNQIVVHNKDGYLVRLSDVGRVEFSAQEERSKVFFNGRRAVGLGIAKKSVGNPLEISSKLKELFPKIESTLPKGIKAEVASDSTIFIKKSIDEVYKTIGEATIFVLIVIGLFLWSLRASLIPLVTIPVSLITTFALIYLMGFTINSLTLLAMVLAIGLVVDDAIVVMENVHRYISQGMHPMQAAMKGTKEISMAVVAMTLTLVAVYAPIAMIPGFIGKLFIEFALTLAGAVLVSGFVALTLSPMMCSRLLKPHVHREKQAPNDRFLNWLETTYERSLRVVIKHRIVMLMVGAILTLGGYVTSQYIDKELAPREDKGMVIGNGLPPQSVTLDYVNRYMEQVDAIMALQPEIINRLVITDPVRPYSKNMLVDWKKRKRSSTDITKALKPYLDEIAGIRASASIGGSLISGGNVSDDTLEFVIQTTQSYEDLDRVGHTIEQKLHQSQLFTIIQHDIGIETQDYAVYVNRDKAAALGVDVSLVGETLDALIKGKVATHLRLDTEEYKVITEVTAANRQSALDLSGIYVKGFKDAQIPLANLITVERRSMPVERHHYNKLRSITVSAKLREGISMGTAVDFIQKDVQKDVPDHIRTSFTGQTKQFLESKDTVLYLFVLALLFIYLVMSAQFESFKDPLIILLSVPLSITGALVTLKLTGGTLNIYSQIGLVTLIGLITKHGILIVDFANTKFDEGLDLANAAVEAAKLRLRPILMTTAAMVLGALPLAIATGPGSESRQQIGWVIVGGMFFGTLFTLFVLPAVYTFFHRKKRELHPEMAD